MARLDYQRTVIGYHGCDRATAEQVLLGRTKLVASSNDYDWLGQGIYFWEYGPERALRWAQEIAKRWPDRVREPAVLGAVLHLGQCFDLLDVRNTDSLAGLFPLFQEELRRAEQPLPSNAGVVGEECELVLRRLDCAVLNWTIQTLEREVGFKFQTVRSVFQEGEPAFPGAKIMRRSHIQIAVRDAGCVLGYFRPET